MHNNSAANDFRVFIPYVSRETGAFLGYYLIDLPTAGPTAARLLGFATPMPDGGVMLTVRRRRRGRAIAGGSSSRCAGGGGVQPPWPLLGQGSSGRPRAGLCRRHKAPPLTESRRRRWRPAALPANTAVVLPAPFSHAQANKDEDTGLLQLLVRNATTAVSVLMEGVEVWDEERENVSCWGWGTSSDVGQGQGGCPSCLHALPACMRRRSSWRAATAAAGRVCHRIAGTGQAQRRADCVQHAAAPGSDRLQRCCPPTIHLPPLYCAQVLDNQIVASYTYEKLPQEAVKASAAAAAATCLCGRTGAGCWLRRTYAGVACMHQRPLASSPKHTPLATPCRRR